jgi:hypothetical protein
MFATHKEAPMDQDTALPSAFVQGALADTPALAFVQEPYRTRIMRDAYHCGSVVSLVVGFDYLEVVFEDGTSVTYR